MSIERGSLLYQTGRHELAEQEFRAALVQEPTNALAHAMIGLCLLEQKKYAEATVEAQQAIGLRPDWDVGYSALAAILSARERLKDAAMMAERAIQLDPFDPAHHARLAEIRIKQRKWEAALTAAEAGLANDPQNAACSNARSLALVGLGRHEQARAGIDGTLRVDPQNPVTHATKAWAQLYRGDAAAAVGHFEESLRINPNSLWAQTGRESALKTRSPIVRVGQRYVFFVSRLAGWGPWSVLCGIMLAGYAGLWELHKNCNDDTILKVVLMLLQVAYMWVVLSTWMGSPFCNRLMRLGLVYNFRARRLFFVVGLISTTVIMLFTFLPFWLED